jgi:hypothetical protein
MESLYKTIKKDLYIIFKAIDESESLSPENKLEGLLIIKKALSLINAHIGDINHIDSNHIDLIVEGMLQLVDDISFKELREEPIATEKLYVIFNVIELIQLNYIIYEEGNK